MHRKALWDLLEFRRISAGIVGLLTGLYSRTESVMKWEEVSVSSLFPVNTGVRQGCVLAPSFFNTCMDWLLIRVVNQSHCGTSVCKTKITDLMFAYDTVNLT